MARPSDPNAKIELLRAAEEVFSAHGLEAAKIEEITRRAGRSKGSFYLHFASKEDAFRQIVESMLARLLVLLDDQCSAMEQATGGLAEMAARLVEADTAMFEYLWQNRGVTRLLLSGGGSTRFGWLIDEVAERCRATTKRWLAWGIERGLYRADLDVELTSLIISGAYDRLARELVRKDKKPDLRAWVGEVQRGVMRGIATPRLVRVIDSQVTSAKRAARSPRAERLRP